LSALKKIYKFFDKTKKADDELHRSSPAYTCFIYFIFLKNIKNPAIFYTTGIYKKA